MILSNRRYLMMVAGAVAALGGMLADAGGSHAQSIRTRGYELQKSAGRGGPSVSSPPAVRVAPPAPVVTTPPAVVSGSPGLNLARPLQAPGAPAVTGQFGVTQPGTAPVVVSPSFPAGTTFVSPAPYYRSSPVWYEWVPSRNCWLMHTVGGIR